MTYNCSRYINITFVSSIQMEETNKIHTTMLFLHVVLIKSFLLE